MVGGDMGVVLKCVCFVLFEWMCRFFDRIWLLFERLDVLIDGVVVNWGIVEIRVGGVMEYVISVLCVGGRIELEVCDDWCL